MYVTDVNSKFLKRCEDTSTLSSRSATITPLVHPHSTMKPKLPPPQQICFTKKLHPSYRIHAGPQRKEEHGTMTTDQLVTTRVSRLWTHLLSPHAAHWAWLSAITAKDSLARQVYNDSQVGRQVYNDGQVRRKVSKAGRLGRLRAVIRLSGYP